MIWFWYDRNWTYESRLAGATRWNYCPITFQEEEALLGKNDILIELSWKVVYV